MTQRRITTKDPDSLLLFVGDTHCGGITALAPAARCDTEDQVWLLAQWQAMVARALAEAKGRPFNLMLGGDLIDGIHHGGRGSWGTRKQQRDAAIELLLPLANKASAIYGILGTDTHAGDESEDDKEVAQQLGAKTARHVWKLDVGGRRLFWTHHLTTVARDPTIEDNGMLATARRHYEWSLRGGVKPDLLIGHHNHFSPDPVTRHGITVAVCPCWQMQNGYGAKIGPERTPAIGVLAWQPQAHRLEQWLYHKQDDYEALQVR